MATTSDSNSTAYCLLEVEVSPAEIDALSAVLWELDTSGFEEVAHQERIRVAAYFPIADGPAALEKTFRQATGHLSIPALKVTRFDCSPDEWLENFSRNFHAFAVGDTYYIHPGWEAPSAIHRVNLLLEPGHGFGTGTHESTQLVLLALEHLAPEAQTLLDVGTGSGILAIAARKLNPALDITALDIDEMAVEFAGRNVARNQAEPVRLLVGQPAAVDSRFNIVLANLTYNLLRQVCADLCRLAREHIVVSGFTRDQECLVTETFQAQTRFTVAHRFELNEWICLDLRLCSES